jgi:hypothetical protein
MRSLQILQTKLGSIALLGTFTAFGSMAAPGQDPAKEQAPNSSITTSVVIVADGSPDDPAHTVSAVIEKLTTELGRQVSSKVVRFDVEPKGEETSGAGAAQPALAVRTPMRDAVAIALKGLAAETTPRRAMIIVAAGEYYGSPISRGRLVDTAREQEIPVYSVSVSRQTSKEPAGFFKRIGRGFSNVGIWMVEALIQEDSSPTAKETARLLTDLSKATGGQTCTAVDTESGSKCAVTIAQEVKKPR